MKIAVIGSTGQLGIDLMKTLNDGHEVVGLAHKDIEVADYDSCLILKDHRPEIVINTAAFHKTDQCEEEPLKAFSVNALGARNVALVSKEIAATAVFISTDYVFDGSKKEPYNEDRIASVFGKAGASGKGGNFVETMITKAKKNETITVIDDMWMSPTYTKDASSILKGILELQLPFGVYHATNKGYCSWYQFTQEIFQLTGLNPTLTPIKTEQLNLKARRPRFSALTSTKLSRYNLEPREWKEALRAYLIEKGHI